MYSFVPGRMAIPSLDEDGPRAVLILANCLAILVGIDFYLPQLMGHRDVLLWPLIIDSPLSVAWLTFSLFALSGAGSIDRYRHTWLHELVDTLAFASLVKYGVWTVFTLDYFLSAYITDVWTYLGLVLAHVVMIVEAFFLPYYAKTNRRVLAIVLLWLLAGDVADYGFGLHPHLTVEHLGLLPMVTVALSILSVGLAWYSLDGGRAGRSETVA